MEEASTGQVMDEALRWSARHGAGADERAESDATATTVLKAEVARLVASYAAETIDEALWRLRHASDRTNGRARAQAIALLEVAVAEADKGPHLT